MNEEEKQAINYLKDFRNEVYNGVGTGSVMAKNIDIIFAIIEKQQKQIEELKYHIHYKICAWCGDEFKTKIHNARYCPKCRETKRREIRISNCKKHYENNKDYFKNYYQNLTDEQKERRRANNREANRRLRERKKCK